MTITPLLHTSRGMMATAWTVALCILQVFYAQASDFQLITSIQDVCLGSDQLDTTNLDDFLDDPDVVLDVEMILPPVRGRASLEESTMTLEYRSPFGNFHQDSLGISFCDSGECDTLMIYYHYQGASHLLTRTDLAVMHKDSSFSANILYNDLDLNGKKLESSSSFLVPPSHGNVVVGKDGSYTYQPEPGFTGNDHFSALVCTQERARQCRKVRVDVVVIDPEVECPNSLVALPDNYVMPLLGKVESNVLANDISRAVAGLMIRTVHKYTSWGHLEMDPFGNFSYTNLEYGTGRDTFTYEACIEHGDCIQCDTAQVEILIEDVLNPCRDWRSSINDDMFSGCGGGSILGNVLSNDVDFDVNMVSVRLDPGFLPRHGSTQHTGNGYFRYRPDPEFRGIDRFGYMVCYNNGECSKATVFIEVLDKIKPRLVEDRYFVSSGGCRTFSLNSNDLSLDGWDHTTFKVLSGGESGDFVMTDKGLEFCPDGAFIGTDTLKYTLEGIPTPCQTSVPDTGCLFIEASGFLSLFERLELEARMVDGSGIELTWNPTKREELALVREASLTSDTLMLSSERSSQGRYLDTDCLPGHTYSYHMVDQARGEKISDRVAVQYEKTTIPRWSRWGNEFCLLDEGSYPTVAVYDLNGKKLHQDYGSNLCMDLENLPSGIYIFQVRKAGETWTTKVFR